MEIKCVSCSVGKGFPLCHRCTRLANANQLYDEALMSMWGTTTIPYSPRLEVGHTVKYEAKDFMICGVETNFDTNTSEIWFVTPELYQRINRIAKVLHSIAYCNDCEVEKELQIRGHDDEKNEEITVYKCPKCGR